jgi:trimethylamine-N-oxide reductase cytochrome c-type subunit TorC
MRRLWTAISRPSTVYSLGFLVFIGGLGGIVFWGGFNTAMEATNTTEFCITCHEMHDNVYQEYKTSAHYQNASGVRASCSDCHVPHAWGPKVLRKIYASRELFYHFSGKLDTPEKFEEHRAELAQRVWASMEANDSRECRNCHSFEAMDFSRQSEKASTEMQKAHASGDTCISCHKGIAHRLPNLAAGFKKTFGELQALAARQGTDVDRLYTIVTRNAYLSPEDLAAGGRAAASLLPATGLTVLERRGDALKVRLEGWQQEGAERVIYTQMGQRIFDAALTPDAIGRIESLDTVVNQQTDQTWHRVGLDLWVSPGEMIDDPARLWAYGDQMHQASCSTCHSLHKPGEHLANQWIGILKSMERFITLDKEETRMLQKYLQLHASDIEERPL